MRLAADPRIVRAVLHEDLHSDVEDEDEDEDEDWDEGGARVVRPKVWRNPVLTAVFRACDKAAGRLANRNPTPSPPPQLDASRIYGDFPRYSADLSSPSVHLPLDIFSPDWYNNELTIQERASYSSTPVLPSFNDPTIGRDISAVMASLTLKSDDFIQRHGALTAGAYNIPTEEDLEKLRAYRMIV